MSFFNCKGVVVLVFICFISGCSSNKTTERFNVNANALTLDKNTGRTYYKDNLFTGLGIHYNSFDQVDETISYVKGIKDGIRRKYFYDGSMSYEANYVNGILDGEARSWWNNGKLRSVSHYANGKVNGIQQQWYYSGELFKELQIVNGKEQGLQRAWRKNGKIINNYEARNGRIYGLRKSQLCYELEEEDIKF